MVWWFRFVLVAHLLGVFLLIGAMALQTTVDVLMRQAAGSNDVRATLKLARSVPRLFAASTWLILGSGIYLTVVLARIGEPRIWAVISFAAVIVLAVWGKISGTRRNGGIARLLRDSEDRFTPNLRELLQSSAPFAHAALGVWVVAGIVVLMVYRPNLWASIAVLVVALLASLVTRAWPYRRAKQFAGKPSVV
ncbi:MAG: hypothetical protein ACRESR_02430 [Gammaproteobacteria bacterium]